MNRQVGWEVEETTIQTLLRVAMSPRGISHLQLVPSMGPIVSAAMTLYIAS